MKAPDGWHAIKEFYGWNEHYLGDLPSWEANMELVRPPHGRVFTYDGKPARGIRVHAKISAELGVCLELIAQAGLWRFVEAIGGGYNFRTQRGSASKLSMHSLGAAVDFDPAANPLGMDIENTALGSEPGLGVVRIFEGRGWTWGGHWGRPDSMHVQFAAGF